MCLYWKIAGKSKLNLMVIVVCLLLCGTLILPIASDTYTHKRNSNSNTVDTGLCICDCSLVRWCVFPYHRMDSSYLRDSKRYTVISPFKNWKKLKIYFLQRFLTNNPFCRSAYFNKLFMVPIGKTMVFKSFWLCTFLGNPVALFYVFSYHPFWEVFWTMVYDTNGWNRLKTGFFGLKLALRRNIDLFI